MAKIRHNNYIDTLVQIAKKGVEHGVLKLYAEDESFSGRSLIVKGKELLHFGTTGYLGLEQDPRVKQGAIDAIMHYGTQFPLSKTYISHTAYGVLEDKLKQMYGYHVLVTKNSTLGHLGVIPSIIRDEDALILDQQVHWSVQNSCQIVKSREVPVELIRHNDMEMLEDKIRQLSASGRKIWYFADGIYSMFGDYAPIDKLKELCEKYPQLYLYFDDVHGMSWVGKNGTGYVLSQYDPLPENIIVFTTLSKTFGASGSTMITANEELFTRVKSFGGPLTFSAQLEPSAVGAAIASADIHLSDEIYQLQKDLREKVDYCNELLAQTDLPLIEKNDCPVFYIGTGAPSVGYNFVKKMMDAGFYVNMGIFPAVAVKKTGVRFTISRHNEKDDIKALINAMVKWYPIAIQEESYTNNQIRKIFGLPLVEEIESESKEPGKFTVELFDTCKKVDPDTWDDCFAGKNIFDYQGISFLERVFAKTLQQEHNWDFRYVIIKDAQGKVVLATFFTKTLWKDDMLAPASVSLQMEKRRKSEPLYHTSTVLAMGSLFTEGDHLYVDESHPDAELAIKELFKVVSRLDAELNPDVIALRDFVFEDESLSHSFDGQGFVPVMLPEACTLDLNCWQTEIDYVKTLSPKSRKHFKKDIEPYLDNISIETRGSLDEDGLKRAYRLYLNVWDKNYELNTFAYGFELFEAMNRSDLWEFIIARPVGSQNTDEIVSVMFCYKNSNQTYVPSLIGMDYDYYKDFSIYRQMLYATILRAKSEGYKRIDFGLSASFEKKKVGATITAKKAFIQAKDNFAMEMMEVMHGAASK